MISRKKVLFVLFILTFLILFFIVSINVNNYLSFINSHTKNTDFLEIEIKKGQNINDVFENLIKQGFISEKQILGIPAHKIYVYLEPQFNKDTIKAGKHLIPPKSKIKDLIHIITQNTHCDQIRITIPEGLRVEEIADIYETKVNSKDKKFDKQKFINIARNFSNHKNNQNEFLKTNYPQNLEGYLFPDTYSLCIDEITEEKIIKMMLMNFEQKFYPLLSTYKTNFTLDEIMKLASILERESKKNEERRIIAGILIKRLEIKMPLGVDATSQYGFGYSEKEKTWWPKNEDLLIAIELNNPYNTRKKLGLPPTPISNPGLDSIKAVLEYQSSDYLYYLHDDCGNVHYSKTLIEHEQKTKKYIGQGCKK